MGKREIILDAMRVLFKEGKAGTASVSDIAKKAGIAKGGLYYYFRSKEEVLDALLEQEYADIIASCKAIVEQSKGSAISKLALLLRSYRSSYVDLSLDEHLHLPQNAALHQKSLAQILHAMSQIISQIIEQGILDGDFACEYPLQYSEIIMSVFTFLLDPGIFPWTEEEMTRKMKALADMLEKGFGVENESFSFLYSQ